MLAPWTSWRNGLQRHEVEAVPGSKYMELVSADKIFPAVEDWRSVDCPTLAILDNLANSGWRRGNAPRLHTLDGPKKMRQVNDPVKERAYLQCLVGLANLVAEGGGSGLRSDQRLGYYKVICGPKNICDMLSQVIFSIISALSTGWTHKGCFWGASLSPMRWEIGTCNFDWVGITFARGMAPCNRKTSLGQCLGAFLGH